MFESSQSTATLVPQEEHPGLKRRVLWETPTIPSSLGILGEPPEAKVHEDFGTLGPNFDQMVDVEIPKLAPLQVPSDKPKPIINDSALSMLTDRTRKTLNSLYNILELVARRNYTPVSKVEVSGFVDPEEDDQEVVVTQWVKLSPQAALDYWDKLSAAVEAWIEYLPDDLKDVAIERLAIEVRWP